jgi:hypothetical protein
MKISNEALETANRRATAKKETSPVAISVHYDPHISRVVIALDTGIELAFSPHDAQGLENAHPEDLIDAKITPSGLGVYFPHLDTDLYLPALLEGFLGSKRWIAAEMGKKGGKVLSEKKAIAARQNGKLGGRPKKSKEFGIVPCRP